MLCEVITALFEVLPKMMSEADIRVTVKALVRKHKCTEMDAHAFVLSFGMKNMSRLVFEDIDKAFVKGMDKVQRYCNHMNGNVGQVMRKGVDMARVDPVIRRAAMQEPELNIHFEDCSDLARQLEECKRRAGVR